MKFTGFALVAAFVALRSVGAFVAPPTPQASLLRTWTRSSKSGLVCSSSSSSSNDDNSPSLVGKSNNICNIPDNVENNNVRLADLPQGAQVLRRLDLTAADGSTVNLGSQMGDGTLASDASRKLQPRLAGAATTTGPLFVSIGDAAKLAKFLQLNPDVPAENCFVDNYHLEAYTAAGFGKIDTTTTTSSGSKLLPRGASLQPPDLGGLGGWWKYLTNVASVSPSPTASVSTNQVLESVLRLGGTFVVKGDEVVYQWNDVIPGDTPDLEEVLAAVKSA